MNTLLKELYDALLAIRYEKADKHTTNFTWKSPTFGERPLEALAFRGHINKTLWEQLKRSAMPIPWRELLVFDTNSKQTCGTLGEIVDTSFSAVNIAVCDGKLDWWPHHYVYVDGEQPSTETPQAQVDWAGFAEAIRQVHSKGDDDAS